MRIIGGTHKGQKILLPKNFKSRPTTDFAREALFNYLSHQFTGDECSFLDLFGGSGAVSFEACSRGYGPVYTLELDVNNYRTLHKNASLFSENKPHLLRQDAFRWIRKSPMTFDVIFADPPFTFVKKITPFLKEMAESPILKPNGQFIVEHPKEFDPSDSGYDFETRNFGNQRFSIFTKN